MSNNIPTELKYVASHEWLRLEEDDAITVGITHHAQELLGDIVFVELPEVGANLAAEEQSGVVESVKPHPTCMRRLRAKSLPSTMTCQARRKPPTATLTAQAGSSKSNLPILPITTVC